MLTACCFQLLFGRIYTFYTPKYVFLTLIGLFEVGSTVCAAAPNSTAFIVGRAIAGLGSAGITSGAIILMVGVIPLEKRPKVSLRCLDPWVDLCPDSCISIKACSAPSSASLRSSVHYSEVCSRRTSLG